MNWQSLERHARQLRAIGMLAAAIAAPACVTTPSAPDADAAVNDAASPDVLPDEAVEALDAGPPYVRPAPPPELAAAVESFRMDLERSEIPGGAIAIVTGGRLTYAAGFGVRRHYRPQLVTDATLFRVGSITKMMTAAALLSLVDEGRIDVSRPVTTYVPYFTLRPPADPNSVTVRQLLTHTSGIPDDLTVSCPTGPGALADLVRARTDTALFAPAGAVWNYTNAGYTVAGLVAETVAGMPYDELMRARVFGPAGMTTATFDPIAAQAADHAAGHLVSSTGAFGLTYEPTSYDCAGAHPPGYLFASVTDYAKWIEVLLASGRPVLSPESAAAMQADQVPTGSTPVQHYGYGLFSEPYRGVRLVSHGGTTLGYETSVLMVPSANAGVVVFFNANRPGFSARSVALRVLNSALSLAPGTTPVYSTPASTWGVYTGTYDDANHFGRLEISLRGTTLWVTGATGIDGPLRQIAGDRFDYTATGSLADSFGVTFWRNDATAPAEYFVTRLGVGARVH